MISNLLTRSTIHASVRHPVLQDSWKDSRRKASDHLVMNGNVTLKRDRKAKDIWLITTTDREGYHRQMPITFDDMRELVRLWIDEVI